MPRAVVKIQSAPRKSRWTLAPNESNLPSPTWAGAEYADKEKTAMMQTNGAYHEPPLPRYESYDGSQYSAPFDRRSANGLSNGIGAGDSYAAEDFTYNTPIEERASHQISLNTRMHAQNQHDPVGHHMLYETAMMDTQSYEILDMAEVDALKKEHARLDSRIEAAKRKLALESKVKDAAQNLQRLYAGNKSRPDTPQSPGSPPQKKGRSSLMGGRTVSSSSGRGSLSQAEDELAVSTRKVDELHSGINALLDRRQNVERKLLRHTAAVLAEQAARASKQISGTNLTNGTSRQVGDHAQSDSEDDDDDDEKSTYEPDEFDGIRDILHGVHAGSGHRHRKTAGHGAAKLQQEHEQQMVSVQSRLEQLNGQLRYVIAEASRSRGTSPEPEPGLDDSELDDPSSRLDGYLTRLEHTVATLQQEQEDVKTHYRYLQDFNETRNTALEEAHQKAAGHAQRVDEYEATLGGLWEILQSDIPSRRPSTISTGGAAKDSLDEERGGHLSPLPSPGIPSPIREDFSLQAFSARVQHIFDRAQNAKEQQEILRRQIQQQRELNGKSDAEKDRQLTDLQERHEMLDTEHRSLKGEIAEAVAGREKAETEAGGLKVELMNVGNELEALKKTVEARQGESAEIRGQTEKLREQVEDLEAQIADLTDDARISAAESDGKQREAEEKHDDLSSQLAAAVEARSTAETNHDAIKRDMTGLESEVVRLTTELTMAKAELEGAYGSRAERAREAQAAEVASLTTQHRDVSAQLAQLKQDHEGLKSDHDSLRATHATTLASLESLRTEHQQQQQQRSAQPQQQDEEVRNRTALLEAELKDMTQEFQDLTRESLQLEKERGQLEEVIDALREKCQELEVQLSDEKVRWLGVRSPTANPSEGGGGEMQRNGTVATAPPPPNREMTSTMVLRQEFKKMMREARQEGVRALRAEQEHRRQLEAELRRLRQASGPLAVRAS
ncbi:hypothetical protein D0865_05502 [Hortaea werneckii]|uniref:REM-1 domain-containing protein n=1 Tax=Hortaea werneckii TaxID=91943 RepID=A0A3M7CM71_HORWE|nr:hypothetical protein D0865_05502 [Hortaea werneckii]